MKNYEITEEQIKELAKGNAKVKNWFPEVFENKTGWFKTKTEGNESYLMYFENNISKYGFNGIGRFKDNACSNISDDEYLATDSEVLEALTNEAKKRGLVEKTYILSAKSGVAFKTFERNYYLDKDGCFRLDGVVIMQNGIWATPIKTYTKEEAEKMLNAKII